MKFKIKQEKLISENQKRMALAKYDIVRSWIDFRNNEKREKKNKYFKNINIIFNNIFANNMHI